MANKSERSHIDALQKHDWNSVCSRLENEEKDFSCAQILEAARPSLDSIISEPESGWLNYTYQYAVSLSYPESARIKKDSPYNEGALSLLGLLQQFYRSAKRRLLVPGHLDFDLPTEAEVAQSKYAKEYHLAQRKMEHCFVYEMMRLSQETTPYKTLEHIARVHNLAMALGRQLLAAGAAVDLAILSAATALHDIGKYGCKEGESVPYLHYHYTEQWCKTAAAPNISRVTANHSVWDLESDNLCVESLLLIYADFRVKQFFDADGKEHTQVYSLSDSFTVVLKKLDNLDAIKKRRYSLAYAKLRDFEAYMRHLGVDIDQAGD